MTGGTDTLARSIRARAQRLEGGPSDYDALLEMAGSRSLVLLGAASHGTSEFYRMRADITRRLIEEKGFDAVATDADWPAAYRLHAYVTGGEDAALPEVFAGFRRFPPWIWRNREVSDFIAWLRSCNKLRAERPVGFYGLDLYSLYESLDLVIHYLEEVDPREAAAARRMCDCLDHVSAARQSACQAAFRRRPSCRTDIMRQLKELRLRSARYLAADGIETAGGELNAGPNAQPACNAEAYYRGLFGKRVDTRNLRDSHMTSVLFDLQRHLRRNGGAGKIVVWAHNSRLGDARATEMGWSGEQNIGQRVRMRAGYDDVLLIGFTTYTGFVTAARQWNAQAEHRWVRPGLEDSYEHLFHNAGLDRFFLPLKGAAGHPLRNSVLLERAIGLIYRPETERSSHYFRAAIKPQYDAIFHLDETSAVEPLDAPAAARGRCETPEIHSPGV